MRKLQGKELSMAETYMGHAAAEACKSQCERAHCGSIVVASDGVIMGWGYNSPPGQFFPKWNGKDWIPVNTDRCACDKSKYHSKVTDKTCCVHAEQRAILNAMSNASGMAEKQPCIWSEWSCGIRDDLRNSFDRLFFTRVDENGMCKRSGKPYCTICSKMALDVGIREFNLWHEDGIYAYPTDEYNRLSYEYSEDKDVPQTETPQTQEKTS